MKLREIFAETASAGSTSSGSVATVVPGKKSPSVSKRKNKNGTVKNALDTNDNIFGNTVLKR
jgi:hypothetical protein